MIEYTWSISQLERQSGTGGVITVHWRVGAKEGEYSSEAYGRVGFSPDPESEDFVPFENLTQEIVLNWIWNNGVDKEETELGLSNQIETQKNPPVIHGLPW